MKKDYIKPESSFTEFKTVEVITTSTESTTKIGVDEDGWINKWY